MHKKVINICVKILKIIKNTHFGRPRKSPKPCFVRGSVVKIWHGFPKSTIYHADDHNIAKPGKRGGEVVNNVLVMRQSNEGVHLHERMFFA